MQCLGSRSVYLCELKLYTRIVELNWVLLRIGTTVHRMGPWVLNIRVCSIMRCLLKYLPQYFYPIVDWWTLPLLHVEQIYSHFRAVGSILLLLFYV